MTRNIVFEKKIGKVTKQINNCSLHQVTTATHDVMDRIWSPELHYNIKSAHISTRKLKHMQKVEGRLTHSQENKKEIDRNHPEEAQTLNLVDKDFKLLSWTSNQGGSIGRYTLPPWKPKKGWQPILKQKSIRPARKSNCMEVQQPRI